MAKYRTKIDFVGTDVETKIIAKKFKIKLGKSSCLFPISDISNETVQSGIKPDQVHNLVVYHTAEKHLEVDASYDILVFTSPSNVRAYFSANPFHAHQKIVAIGPSTATQIEKLNHPVHQVSVQPGELGMIDAILACNSEE